MIPNLHITWHTLFVLIYVILLFGLIFYQPQYAKLGTSFTKKDFRYFISLLLIGLILMLVFVKLGIFTFSLNYNLWHSILIFLSILVIISPAEEIIFRGIIQAHFANYMGIVGGIIAASLVFGLSHLPNGAEGWALSLWNWKFAFVATIGGVLFGIAFANSSSILMPVILHAIISSIYALFLKSNT